MDLITILVFCVLGICIGLLVETYTYYVEPTLRLLKSRATHHAEDVGNRMNDHLHY